MFNFVVSKIEKKIAYNNNNTFFYYYCYFMQLSYKIIIYEKIKTVLRLIHVSNVFFFLLVFKAWTEYLLLDHG